ncbi:MAG: D-alanyl-D-alanine carboxypeptidase/D-alanyl-D-alanine-endopeptidase [Ginsengibacter sp.]
MKKLVCLLFLFGTIHAHSQISSATIKSAYTKFINYPAFKHSSISLYVVNTKTGKPVLEENAQMGLAPASTLKVVTSAAAYAILGRDYRYETKLSYSGKIDKGILNGDIIITGSGDPTLGSWRYESAKEQNVLAEFMKAIARQGINEITGNVLVDESLWTGEITPNGWIWQDMGNYYGVGARTLNWRENQYDLFLKSGNQINNSVEITGTLPAHVVGLNLSSVAKAAAKGTGDNAYIYHPLNDPTGYVRGTIPAGENKFKISGSMPNGAQQLAMTLEAALKKTTLKNIEEAYPVMKAGKPGTFFYTYYSPTMDSISYWFVNKSINLYGEAMLKTMGLQEGQSGETSSGVKVMKDFWKKNGIDPTALSIQDGSGLSPGNRITTSSLVQVLQYGKKQDWFNSWFEGFPLINGIKMKSGTIGGALGYTGFIKSKTGEEYTFAFIINNYDGGASETRRKMWRFLDLLK